MTHPRLSCTESKFWIESADLEGLLLFCHLHLECQLVNTVVNHIVDHI